MEDVRHDVEIEPLLQPLQGESFVNKSTTRQEKVRLDIKPNGLWGHCFNLCFLEVEIFNLLAKTLPDPYKYHGNLKKLKYQERILDFEHSSFVPPIFLCAGGAAPSATKVKQRLAKIGEKRSKSYADAKHYI